MLTSAKATADQSAISKDMLPSSGGGTSASMQVIQSSHADYIHKVAFDTYGRRMATCAGDRFVRVWDLTDEGTWSLAAQWQAHRGAVTSISWAHPEFGSLLATCGSDHDAKIWEERHATHNAATGNGSTTAASLASRWTIRAALTEARRSVTCVEFAPRHWGLKLAVGSADGCVRIYEAVDVMNLSQWPLAATLQSFAEGNHLGCTCLSWSTGRFEPPTLVAGGSHVVIYRYSESARSWLPLLQLPPPEKGDVLDVAWAPNVGRRFHLIASAEDQELRIYRLAREMNIESGNAGAPGTTETNLTLESPQTINTNAWRCQWNVTGTVLASSGDGGVVQMWKANNNGHFECVSTIQGDLNDVGAVTESK